MATYSITRALNELKLLDKKIQKKYKEACFVTYEIGGIPNEMNCDPKKSLQSITDLIKRRDAIKTAIMQSNAVTEVKIGEETMTVAEAIERKSSIQYYKSLLQTMRQQWRYIQTRVQELEEETRDRLDRLLESKLGKEGKTREEDLKAITKNFEEKNMPKIIDPLNLQQQIEELDEYIDNFENEVDLVLSESNARTEINLAD